MTTHIAPNQVRLLKIRRHLTLALLAAMAVTYSAVASTSASSTIDQVIADSEMELAVHWHGNTPHYHVVAAGEQNVSARQPNQVAAFRAPNVAFTTGTHRALVINLVRADGLVAQREVVNARYLRPNDSLNAAGARRGAPRNLHYRLSIHLVRVARSLEPMSIRRIGASEWHPHVECCVPGLDSRSPARCQDRDARMGPQSWVVALELPPVLGGWPARHSGRSR